MRLSTLFTVLAIAAVAVAQVQDKTKQPVSTTAGLPAYKGAAFLTAPINRAALASEDIVRFISFNHLLLVVVTRIMARKDNWGVWVLTLGRG
jgi:hypothetical protein